MTENIAGLVAGRRVPNVASGPVPRHQSFPIRHLKQLRENDCIRTCIAMVLGYDRPDIVPCFYEDGKGGAWDRARNWLWFSGYALVAIPMRPPSVQQAISRLKGNINVPVIVGACCTEDDPTGHCIVVTADNCFDPGCDAPGSHLLGAVHTNGEVWVQAIVPLGGWNDRIDATLKEGQSRG